MAEEENVVGTHANKAAVAVMLGSTEENVRLFCCNASMAYSNTMSTTPNQEQREEERQMKFMRQKKRQACRERIQPVHGE